MIDGIRKIIGKKSLAIIRATKENADNIKAALIKYLFGAFSVLLFSFTTDSSFDYYIGA